MAMLNAAALLAIMVAQGATPAAIPFDRTLSSSDDYPSIAVLCDPKKFRFSIRANADAASLDRRYPRRTVIDPASLMQLLPGSTGEPDIRAPLIRYVRCGPFTIKLQGDAYNANVQGESGAYPEFAAVSLIIGNQMLFDNVRLTECDRSLPRAHGCPEGYAVRIDGRYDAPHRALALVRHVSSFDEGDVSGRRSEVKPSTEALDLSLWPAAYDD